MHNTKKYTKLNYKKTNKSIKYFMSVFVKMRTWHAFKEHFVNRFDLIYANTILTLPSVLYKFNCCSLRIQLCAIIVLLQSRKFTQHLINVIKKHVRVLW